MIDVEDGVENAVIGCKSDRLMSWLGMDTRWLVALMTILSVAHKNVGIALKPFIYALHQLAI